MRTITWISLLLIIYHLFLYKYLLKLISFLKKNSNKIDKKESNNNLPFISILIAAHNEEESIKERIINLINLDYPKEKIEYIIVDDCSLDNTVKIVYELKQENSIHNLIIVSDGIRRGKSGSLNKGYEFVTGDYILLSDANTKFNQDTIRHLLDGFSNNKIGAVRGTLIVQNRDNKIENVSGVETNFWNSELEITQLEADIDSCIALPGAIYMIKKELFSIMPTEFTIMDDFYQAIMVLKSNHNIAYSKKALAFEYNSEDMLGEFKRKTRIATANFNIFKFTLLSIFKDKYSPTIKFFLFSHKILRWILPFLYTIFLISSLLLSSTKHLNIYSIFTIFNITHLYFAINGAIFDYFKIEFPNNLIQKIFRFNLYFILMVIATYIGLYKSFQKTTPYWNRVSRQ